MCRTSPHARPQSLQQSEPGNSRLTPTVPTSGCLVQTCKQPISCHRVGAARRSCLAYKRKQHPLGARTQGRQAHRASIDIEDAVGDVDEEAGMTGMPHIAVQVLQQGDQAVSVSSACTRRAGSHYAWSGLQEQICHAVLGLGGVHHGVFCDAVQVLQQRDQAVSVSSACTE